jgi:hypothetical protein
MIPVSVQPLSASRIERIDCPRRVSDDVPMGLEERIHRDP